MSGEIANGSVLVTGGAGFVGSNLAICLRQRNPNLEIIAADNLRRRGSELNLPRLRENGIRFCHCDIRNPEDLRFEGNPHIGLIIECSAEPSVLAGYDGSPEYVINTNLRGTVNCLELARLHRADFIFLSTSRVYPTRTLNSIVTVEGETRFHIAPDQTMPGVSVEGINEQFSLEGPRSMYGATKLSSELLIQEYGDMYGVRYVINRCGVLTGPWQMGKVEQGVFALWVAMHYFQQGLSYIGWGGQGKQVRDLLHIDDLGELLKLQITNYQKCAGKTYNVGGGPGISLSLQETTKLCQEITGNKVHIRGIEDNRPADVKLYISDAGRVAADTGWAPQMTPSLVLESLHEWVRTHEKQIRPLFLS